MSAKLPIAQSSFNMRSSVVRALLAASLLVVFVWAFLRVDASQVPSRLLEKARLNGSVDAKQQNLNNDDVSAEDDIARNDQDHDASSSHFDPAISHQQFSCDIDMEHLAEIRQRYQLEERFHYMKRLVRFTRTEGLDRKSMNYLHQDLVTDDLTLVRIGDEFLPQQCAEPLEVRVPKSGLPSTVDASNMMFGVSTTYSRFMDPSTTPINEWIFWLTDSHGRSNGGKLLLTLVDADETELQEIADLLGDVGIDVDVYQSDSSVEMALRYLNLVPTLYTHPEAQDKHWLVTCDDDTFFPNMHGLLEKLATMDHTREMYVGTLSEDVGAIERHGSQAFGGAGVFLSLPMARRVTEMYSSCTADTKILESNSGWGPQGDILLRKCIYENTETRLTMLWDLWQLDIYGDPSGFYEWGHKPLSLHHYRGAGWHSARPGQLTKIAHTCGEDCTMLRFQTTDNFILSGYSIAHYPDGIRFDVNQLEATCGAAPEDRGWNLDFMFGPQRPSLTGTGRKIAWELQESEVQIDGSVLQTYTRRRDDRRWTGPEKLPMSNVDGVIELVWFPSSSP